MNPDSLSIKKGDELEFTFAVTASDTITKDNFPAFTATLKSMGGFWGLEKDTGDDDSWKVNVTAPGEYTIHVTAPENWDFSGALFVDTDLKQLPSDLPYTISGKTAKLGENTYDWHQAEAYKDGDTICLGIWNEWGKDGYSEWNVLANPLSPLNLSEGIESERIKINTAGDYTLKGTFKQDADSDINQLFLATTLKTIPSDFTITGRTIKINGKEYDWGEIEYIYFWQCPPLSLG